MCVRPLKIFLPHYGMFLSLVDTGGTSQIFAVKSEVGVAESHRTRDCKDFPFDVRLWLINFLYTYICVENLFCTTSS